MLYVLPANFRAILRSRSWLLRLEPALAAARSAGAYLVRVSFGTALIASVLLVALSVVALLTAASSSDRDNRRCVTFDKTKLCMLQRTQSFRLRISTFFAYLFYSVH